MSQTWLLILGASQALGDESNSVMHQYDSRYKQNHSRDGDIHVGQRHRQLMTQHCIFHRICKAQRITDHQARMYAVRPKAVALPHRYELGNVWLRRCQRRPRSTHSAPRDEIFPDATQSAHRAEEERHCRRFRLKISAHFFKLTIRLLHAR